MTRTWISITLKEPLLLGSARTGSNFLQSMDYIPGRVIRGTLAEWIIANGRQAEISTLVDGLRLSSFFPSTIWQKIEQVSRLPLSAMSCKKEPGFRSEAAQSRQKHGIVDTLLPRLAYSLLENAGAEMAVPFEVTCPQAGCDGRLERYERFYTVYDSGSTRHYVKIEPAPFSQTKVGISRTRRAAQEGLLYTATAISPQITLPDSSKTGDLVFIGSANGTQEQIDLLLKALNNLPLGALRTRGYGQVQAQVFQFVAAGATLKERLARFNQQLARLLSEFQSLAARPDQASAIPQGHYFSLTLTAPGIFANRSIPSLIPELTIAGQPLSPILWLTRPDQAGGWSGATGLPKLTALAAQMGSVYVYHWAAGQDVLLPVLEQIEETGAGQRCNEGFGQCVICHPLHLEEKVL